MACYDMSFAKHGGTETSAADALFELGLMYSLGRDVAMDLAEAHKWFNLAAIQGHEEARNYRSELAREMSACELRDALGRARAWMGMN